MILKLEFFCRKSEKTTQTHNIQRTTIEIEKIKTANKAAHQIQEQNQRK